MEIKQFTEAYLFNRELTDFLFVSLFHTANNVFKIVSSGKSDFSNIYNEYSLNQDIREICTSCSFGLLTKKKIFLYVDKKFNDENKLKKIGIRHLKNKVYFGFTKHPFIIINGKIIFLEKDNLIKVKADKKIKKLKYKKIIKRLNKIACMPQNMQCINEKIPVDINEYKQLRNEYALKITKRIGGRISEGDGVTNLYSMIRDIRAQKIRYEIIFLIVNKINEYLETFDSGHYYVACIKWDTTNYDKLKNIEEDLKKHSLSHKEIYDIVYSKNFSKVN